MNNKNGKNTTIQNSKSNKPTLGEKLNNLSKKNLDKNKKRSNNNKTKKTDFSTTSNKYGQKNEMIYNNLYGLEDFPKKKLHSSVNYNLYEYDNNLNSINPNETKTKIKKKKSLKKSTNFNYINNNEQRQKDKKHKKEQLEKEIQKEKERIEKEKEKIEKEKREIERIEKEKKEKERMEKEKREKEIREKLELEYREKIREIEEQQRLEAEKVRLEKEKKEKEKKEKELKKQKEKEKKEREKLEKERKEKEKIEKERKEKEKLEKEKIEKEKKEKMKEYKDKEIYKSSRIEEKDNPNLTPEISSITKSKIGLRNLGNTCFMNTCLQNLIHSELFIIKLFSKSSLLSSKTKISKQFYSLCNEVSSCSSTSCSPYDFKSAFGSKHSMFSGYAQHDTQEFCRILLEDMNSELNEVLHPAPYKELSTLNKTKIECDKEFDEVFRKRENSLIMDVFYGQLINIFKCECNFETYSFEKILDLPLLLPKEKISIDIKDLLKNYFECERIKFETKCENCKKKEWHTKEIKISQPPNILILSLQRQNPRTGTKNNSYVDFTDELDMSVYLDHECWNKNDAKYSLYGIGNHSGSIDFGHYYAYIKINNSWYEFNDSSVSPYSKGTNNSSRLAYILFYKKNNI